MSHVSGMTSHWVPFVQCKNVWVGLHRAFVVLKNLLASLLGMGRRSIEVVIFY